LPPISGPSQSVCAWRSAMAMSTSLLIDRSVVQFRQR
jgi:hypothetical protein